MARKTGADRRVAGVTGRAVSRRSGALWVAFVFVAGVGAGLVFLAAFPLPSVQYDAVCYLETARNIAHGAGFTQDGVSPMTYIPPLFSSLLGFWFFVTGTDSPLSAGVFQSLVHGVAVAVALLLFLEVGVAVRWAVAGAVFLALNPILITRVALVLQEPTLMLLTTMAVLSSVRLVKAPSPSRAAWAGFAWGVCTLGKTVTLFAPFLLLGMRILPERRAWRWTWGEAAVLLLCFSATIAPWTVRNAVHLGRFVPVNDQGAGVLEWNVDHATPGGVPSGREFISSLDVDKVVGKDRELALWGFVASHPLYFAVERTVVNAVRFAAWPRDWWLASGMFQPGRHDAVYWVIAAVTQFPPYALLLVGGVRWLRGEASLAIGTVILFYGAYWAVYALLWGEPRYGVPVLPCLVAVALVVLAPVVRTDP